MKGKQTEQLCFPSIPIRKNIIPETNIQLSFPAPENARAIVTLENSTGVLDEIRVNTQKGKYCG